MLTVALKKNVKARILNGYPLAFINELSDHFRAVQPGFPVRLVDANHQFLAYGIGDPNQVVAFRAWSFDPTDQHFFSPNSLISRLANLWMAKYRLGFHDSFRLCYSEGDHLSGIIIDRYLVAGKKKQILVFQITTVAWNLLFESFENFYKLLYQKLVMKLPDLPNPDDTAIIVQQRASITDQKVVQVVHDAGLNLSAVSVIYSRFISSVDKTALVLVTDFLNGQKTGLFLDQSWNIGLVCDQAKTLFFDKQSVKILDLCCYRGAWSTHLAQILGHFGINTEVHLLDQSMQALEQAQFNVAQYVRQIKIHHGDVMTLLDQFPENQFDIIICDPPAFAKSRKTVTRALEGYFHLNRKAVHLLNNENGLYVTCSCSSSVTVEQFRSAVGQALTVYKTRFKQIRLLSQGGLAQDHSINPFYSEGNYLKLLSFWLTHSF